MLNLCQCYKTKYKIIFLFVFLFLYGCSMDPSLFENSLSKKTPQYSDTLMQKKLDQIIVKKGETLFSLARKFNVSVKEIIQLNNLNKDEFIFEGQILFIPTINIKNNNFFINNNTKIVKLPIPKPETKKFNVQKLSTSFSIPLNGDVINKFGSNSDGIMSEGINIEAKYGETVKASANGEVIFVGSDLKDFGTMMLIKHNDKLITCYAHLSKTYVNEGDFIIQGQTIGEVGSTGKVSKPQLYFEIRKNNEPINPEAYINI